MHKISWKRTICIAFVNRLNGFKYAKGYIEQKMSFMHNNKTLKNDEYILYCQSSVKTQCQQIDVVQVFKKNLKRINVYG